MKVGDLIEYSYTFESDSIDPWTKDNSICFVYLRDNTDGKSIWAKPQFPLNEQGKKVLDITKESGFPHTREMLWLLDKKRCRVIDSLTRP